MPPCYLCCMVELASGMRASSLAQQPLSPLFGGIVGNFLLRPWFDAVALPTIVRWYFPLSRAWAAAGAAGSDVDRFFTEVPTAPLPRRMAASALALAASRQRSY